MPSTRSRSQNDFAPSLRKLLMAKHPLDTPELAALWTRHVKDRCPADADRLFELFLPVVWSVVTRVTKRRQMIFSEPLTDYISDGIVGLLAFIRRAKPYHPRLTYVGAVRAISRAVWRESRNRTWAGNHRTMTSRSVQKIREELIAEKGCLPTREQMIARISQRLKTPNVYFFYIDQFEVRELIPRSQLEPNQEFSSSVFDAGVQPIDYLLDDEIKRLALRTLKGTDRRIFKMLIEGHRPFEIADKLGLLRSTFFRRLNGILWQSRCRADLCSYLGVEHDQAPPSRTADSHYPQYKPTPARLLAS